MIINGKVATDQQMSIILDGEIDAQLDSLAAEVVKVERPEGDDARTWGPPFVEGDATGFIALNRGKKSITCDLADPAQREALIERIGAADIFVHNLRADVPAGLPFGPEVARAVADRMISLLVDLHGLDPVEVGAGGVDGVAAGLFGWVGH